MTWLTLRALLSRVPGITWVIVFVSALVLAGIVATYEYGKHAGVVQVHRIALQDSTTHQAAVVAAATRKSDSTVVVARKAVARSTSGRQHTRDVLEANRDSIPIGVMAVVEAQLARDSTTIAVQAAATDTLLSERGARIQLDTLLEHGAVFKPPSTSPVVTVAKVVVVATVVVVAARWVIRNIPKLLHR